MIIRNLTVSNFRKFIDLKLNLPLGVIGIIGKNGSGKSTLLEIVSWLLYGSNALKTKNIQLFPDFIEPRGETSGELCFEIADKTFLVRRLQKSATNSSAMLYVDDKLIAASTTEVNKAVEKLSGLDWKAFQTSFYTRQSELDLLLDLKPAERSKRLEEMLGFEKLNIIIDNIRGDIRSLEGEKKALGYVIDRKTEIEMNRKAKEDEHQMVFSKVATLENEQVAFQEALERQKKAFMELESRRDSFNQVSSDLALWQQSLQVKSERKGFLSIEIASISEERPKLAQLQEEIQELPKVRGLLEEMRIRQLEYEARRQKELQWRELTQLIAGQKEKGQLLKAEIQILKTKAAESIIINNMLRELSAQIKTLQEEVISLKVSESQAESAFRRLQSQLADIEKLGPEAVCSFCLRPFRGEMEEIKAHFQAEMDGLEEARGNARRYHREKAVKLAAAINEKEAQEQARGEAEAVQRKLSASQGEVKALAEEYLANQERCQALQNDLAGHEELGFDPEQLNILQAKSLNLQKKEGELGRLSERLNGLVRLQDESNALDNEIIIINNNISVLKAKLEQIGFSEIGYRAAREELEKATASARKKELELAEARQQEAVMRSEMESLKNQIKLIEESAGRFHEISSQKVYLDTLIEVLKELKIELASRIRPALNKYSSNLLERMSDGKFSELELDEEYNLLIRDYGDLRELNRFSGGEQDLANLSLRMAISQLLARSSNLEAGFLILDEVFGSQDAFRKENILGAIGELQDFFQQIFIVTHVEEIKDAVQTLITVTENPDGSSSIQVE